MAHFVLSDLMDIACIAIYPLWPISIPKYVLTIFPAIILATFLCRLYIHRPYIYIYIYGSHLVVNPKWQISVEWPILHIMFETL